MTAALVELRRSLAVLADADALPPCAEQHGHELWTSDAREDRALAAARCLACPVLDACAAAADEGRERWHVWGGADRTPRPSGAKP